MHYWKRMASLTEYGGDGDGDAWDDGGDDDDDDWDDSRIGEK